MLNESHLAEPGTTSNDLGEAGSSQLEVDSPISSTGSSGVADGDGRFLRPPGIGVGVGAGVVTVGTDSTVISSASEASAAVPRVEESAARTAAAVLEAGTTMVAVMITLAAATLIVTWDLSMPAAAAMFCCKLEVSE